MSIVLMSPAAEAEMNYRRRKEDAQVAMMMGDFEAAITLTVLSLDWYRYMKRLGGDSRFERRFPGMRINRCNCEVSGAEPPVGEASVPPRS